MNETETYQMRDTNPDHLDENELAQYADFLRHDTDSIPERLREHVASCPSCRREVMAIADMMDALPEPVDLAGGGEHEPVSTPGRSEKYSITRFLRIAAAVAAVVAVAWGVRQFFPGQVADVEVAAEQGTDTLTPRDTAGTRQGTPGTRPEHPAEVTRVPDTVKFAEAFVPNITYENLVKARYRAGTDPKVIGPDLAVTFHPGDSLKLSWTPDPQDEYEVVIIDNRERRVAAFKAGSTGDAAWKITLAPGLYYWKFLGREDMWKVGRIKVISE